MPITSVRDAIDIFFSIKKEIKEQADPFVKHLNEDQYIFGLWFRGELDFGETGLTPSIFRTNGGHLKETTINDYLPAINDELRELDNPFDQLCTMQHYDIPSRLLDWSESILTSLYFAVCDIEYDSNGEISEHDKDGKLFCLNVKKLNELTSLRNPPRNIHRPRDFGTLFRTFMIKSNTVEEWSRLADNLEKSRKFDWSHDSINKRYAEYLKLDLKDMEKNNLSPSNKIKLFCSPIGVMPNRIHNRLIFQSGMFTLHGGKLLFDDEINDDHPIPEPSTLLELQKQFSLSGDTFLREYTILSKDKPNVKEELMNIGIHQGTLFPELDKQKEFCYILR